MSERHTMRKIREVLRLKYELGLGHRAIAASCTIGKATVCDYVKRADKAGLTWPQAHELGDAELESRLFRHVGRNEPSARVPIDFGWVHRELRRPGVTLQQLWLEYQEASTQRDGAARAYQYSQFCDLYASFRDRLEPSMRQVHRAGEKAFVDYSGKKPRIVDRETGEVVEVEFFVMVLGASNYTYAEATRIATATPSPAWLGRSGHELEAEGPKIGVEQQCLLSACDHFTTWNGGSCECNQDSVCAGNPTGPRCVGNAAAGAGVCGCLGDADCGSNKCNLVGADGFPGGYCQ